MTWRDSARCGGIDDFTEREESEQMLLCSACPVRTECLQDALESPWDRAGGDGIVRGGMLHRDRRRRPIEGRRHGTYTTYHRYRCRCDECMAAGREQRARVRARGAA